MASSQHRERPLRVAVIGMGPIGNLHADIYRDHPLSELCGVCDRNPDRMKSASQRLGVPGYPEAKEMLASLRPNLVSVTTGGYEYSSDHKIPVLQALEAGCHVLCEKPLSNEVADAREMVESAREKGLCFGTNFNHKCTSLAVRARQWIEEGRLGNLLFINVSMWIGKFTEESSPWFHLKALHPHTVDIMRYFCGDIEAVHCFATKAPGRTIWSTAQFNMKFRNGVVGHLTGSYDIARGHPMERVEVAGTGGRFVLTDMFDELIFYPAGSVEKTVITNTVFGDGPKTFADTFRERIHRFLTQVSEGTAPENIEGSGEDGLATVRVIDAAIESVKTGKVVPVL